MVSRRVVSVPSEERTTSKLSVMTRLQQVSSDASRPCTKAPARSQRSRSKHFFEPKNGGLAFFACHLVNPSRVPDTIAELCQLYELSDQRLLIGEAFRELLPK